MKLTRRSHIMSALTTRLTPVWKTQGSTTLVWRTPEWTTPDWRTPESTTPDWMIPAFRWTPGFGREALPGRVGQDQDLCQGIWIITWGLHGKIRFVAHSIVDNSLTRIGWSSVAVPISHFFLSFRILIHFLLLSGLAISFFTWIIGLACLYLACRWDVF